MLVTDVVIVVVGDTVSELVAVVDVVAVVIQPQLLSVRRLDDALHRPDDTARKGARTRRTQQRLTPGDNFSWSVRREA